MVGLRSELLLFVVAQFLIYFREHLWIRLQQFLNAIDAMNIQGMDF